MPGVKRRDFLATRSQSISKIGSEVEPSRDTIAEISTERLDYEYQKALLRQSANPMSEVRKRYTVQNCYKRAISISSPGTRQSFGASPTIIAWPTTCTRFAS